MIHKVQITEYLSRTIKVEARNWQEAVEQVRKRYYDSEIVLSSDDFDMVEFEPFLEYTDNPQTPVGNV